jgi:RNA polymerase sigma factor (sigma-70 family)
MEMICGIAGDINKTINRYPSARGTRSAYVRVVSTSDLVQAGIMALLQTMESWDEGRDVRLTTLAHWPILRAMQEAIASVRGREMERLGDVESPSDSPLEKVEREDELSRLRSKMKTLSDRDRQIVELRFGIVGGEPMSLVGIGDLFGISKQAVHAIVEKVLAKLR